MTRSHFGGVTYDGQSGGARVSCNSGAIESFLQGEGAGLKMNDIYQCLERHARQYPNSRFAFEVAVFQSQFVDSHMMYMHTNPIPLQIGMVDEQAKRGLSRDVVNNAKIFTQSFLDKHYAQDRKSAEVKASKYNGTVTVIKIVSESNLNEIIQLVKAKKGEITPSTAWTFVNGEYKATHSKVQIGYKVNLVDHLERGK